MERLWKTSLVFAAIIFTAPATGYAAPQTSGPDDKAPVAGPQAPAPEEKSTLTCSDETNNLTEIPANAAAVSVTVTEPYILGLCKAAEGQALSVVTPSAPYTFNIDAGKTVVVAYTVKDASGATAGGSITYIRP
ncbi:hypothetical protein [Asticcacaulis solisilvae]|uniref:hypothetical protein n=1 Tax=Asticcacaulis solisilvae TaxID=1217274 RepID=UPI003FD8224C